jgi:hypothetical protein
MACGLDCHYLVSSWTTVKGLGTDNVIIRLHNVCATKVVQRHGHFVHFLTERRERLM